MGKRLRSAALPLMAALIPLVVFFWLDADPATDMKMEMPKGHFYIVSIVSFIAFLLAIAVGITGRRLRNIKVSFLALAFISLAEVFSVHGLSTPGFLLHASHLPGVAAQLSVTLTAFWMWMSSLRSDSPFVTFFAKRQSKLVPVWTIVLAVIGLASIMFPAAVNRIPIDRNPVQWMLAALSIIFDLAVIYQYWLSYRFTQFPLQIAMVYSAGWLLVAQIIIMQGELWRISWWIYHLLLLAAMLIMLIGLYRQYATGKSLGTALGTLFHFDPVERIEAGISSSIRALIVATEGRDEYTAGHNYRVAVFAMRLAEEIGLGPDELRVLAHGAIVHDVGKIQIPDSVLNKPGKLTEEERKVIELHPIYGYELCKRLGMMKEELEIVRSHHEKWDGGGYPDRLSERKIPKLARLIAVVDVYDALTSARAYRQAWTHEAAMKLIGECSGTHFDPEIVQAWQNVCAAGKPDFRHPSWINA